MRRKYALLIIDMLNTFDFPEADSLLRRAGPIARRIARLKKRCDQRGIPVIYLNDNFGKWQSDRQAIYTACRRDECPGKEIAAILEPTKKDYFIVKPKHSGFYATCLDYLLQTLKVNTLILTGIAGDICVLFTAHDAHIREYNVIVPRDCVASVTAKGDRFLVHQLEDTLKIPTTLSTNLRVGAR